MRDIDLVEKILQKDNAAFEELILKYQKLVYGTSMRLLKNPADAEDISQEVFIEIYRSLHHLKNMDDMSSWIFRIAYTKSISFLRKKNPAKAADLKDIHEQSQSYAVPKKLRSKDTPHLKLEKKEASEILFERIDELPEKQKRALLLHKFEGYSHKEICEIMELSQAAVESLIYRAKSSLKKKLTSFYKNKEL